MNAGSAATAVADECALEAPALPAAPAGISIFGSCGHVTQPGVRLGDAFPRGRGHREREREEKGASRAKAHLPVRRVLADPERPGLGAEHRRVGGGGDGGVSRRLRRGDGVYPLSAGKRHTGRRGFSGDCLLQKEHGCGIVLTPAVAGEAARVDAAVVFAGDAAAVPGCTAFKRTGRGLCEVLSVELVNEQ